MIHFILTGILVLAVTAESNLGGMIGGAIAAVAIISSLSFINPKH